MIEQQAAWPTTKVRVSWGAIFAGSVVVLALQILFCILGSALFTSMVDPIPDLISPQKWMLRMGIWFLITIPFSLLLGGLITSCFAQTSRRIHGLLYGLVTWGFTTLFLCWLTTTTIGTLVSSKIPMASKLTQTLVKETTTTLFPNEHKGNTEDLAPIQNEIKQLFQSTTDPIARIKGLTIIERFITKQGFESKPMNRDEIIEFMMTHIKLEQQQAEKALSRLEEMYQTSKKNTEQSIQERLHTSQKRVMTMTWYFFLLFMLGASAGAIGGLLGTSSSKNS